MAAFLHPMKGFYRCCQYLRFGVFNGFPCAVQIFLHFFFLKVVNQNSSQLGVYRLLLGEGMLKSHSLQK